ncbi:MAG: DUF952 domain-containing protein [Alphaproteobacteria bacterium]
MPSVADDHQRLYHLCPRQAWEAAQSNGAFKASGPDPFIHLSTRDQVIESAALHLAGVADLLLLTIDADALGPALRWEASRGGALFPHLYADLPLDAVIATDPLPLGPDGRHVFPEGFAGSAAP